MDQNLQKIQDDFVAQWGALGSQWGINRTMAMIHALLMVSEQPLDTDKVMGELQISRGNANTNLRELANWGLVRQIVVRGERKDFYEAEKDVWKIFCIVARERKRRETEPATSVLADCIERSKSVPGPESKQLRKQLTDLHDFVSLANSVMEKIASKEQSAVVPRIVKLLA